MKAKGDVDAEDATGNYVHTDEQIKWLIEARCVRFDSQFRMACLPDFPRLYWTASQTTTIFLRFLRLQDKLNKHASFWVVMAAEYNKVFHADGKRTRTGQQLSHKFSSMQTVSKIFFIFIFTLDIGNFPDFLS